MSNIHQTIKSFLEKYDLNAPELTFLVGFSGGYDSMCLLNTLRKITKNRIVALHLNHNWRGEESDREEANCQDFCTAAGVEFYCEKLSTTVPHTETAAREARYKFFEKCSKLYDSKVIFTAHNKNDNAETILYRIIKGTGVSGLQGIAPHREVFYRPLLDITRQEIETYCAKHHLTPNNDSSNSDTKYKRNFIRAKIMPLLNEVNPNSLEAITSLIQVAQEETEILDSYTQNTLEKISLNGKIKTKKFQNLSTALQNKIIYNLFQTQNLEYDRKKIHSIREFINENKNSKSGKTCSLTNNLWIFVSDKYIEIITQNEQIPPYFHITKPGKYENNGYILELEEFTKPIRKFPPDTEMCAYINLNRTPLDFELRKRNEGDYIQPLGVKGTQKLKKYLNEKKVPNHEKDSLLFLCQGNEILWAAGLGISDKIKITDKPTHRIKLYKANNSKG
ncbi:MAG: tRNA lysidine(34) synthetase TilS [Muribaculaceae bacterium]|nr:tRNA lysidine(34) synthetase TilS [Muribaculaceae bacterium]